MSESQKFENQEVIIDALILKLAETQEMSPEDITSDIVTFAPYEGNEDPNPEYLDQLAEMLGITPEEMTAYAIKKAKEFLSE